VPRHEDNLLSIEAVKEDNPAIQAKGALAEQGVDVCAKHRFLISLAGIFARLKRDHKVKLLTLEFEVDAEQMTVTCDASGPLAGLVRKELDRVHGAVGRLGLPITMRDGALVYNLYQPPVPSQRLVNHMARLVMQGRDPIKPTTCTLQVTARCQLNCYHCSAAKYKTQERQELTTAEWLSVIRQSEEMGCFNITFTGGEPLLREDIYDLIAAVNQDRAHPTMFTNGLLLTEENVARLREADLYALMVSIDDPRPEVHDRLRGLPGAFQKSVAGMERAREAGLLTALSTYASPEDVREGRVEQLIELARDLGLHEVTVFDIVPTGRLLPLEEEGLLTPEDKQQLIALGRHYNQLKDYPHVVTQSEVEGPECAGCMGAHSQFYMTAFGDVDPCDFLPLTFGNVRDEPLEAIWMRMRGHPAFVEHCDHCLMQDAEFRRQYIDHIPEDRLLPWPAYDELRDRPNSPPAIRIEVSAPGLPKKG